MNDNKQDTNRFDDANEMHLNEPEPHTSSAVVDEQKPKPDPKALADAFKQSIQEEKSKSKPQNRNYLYLTVFMIVVVGFVLLWQLSLQRQIDTIKADLNITAVPDENGSLTAPTPVQKISVITPEEFTEVNGEFEVNVEVEGINFVNMKLFDDNGVEIGSKNFDASSSLTEKLTTKQTLSVSKSPTVSSGYLIVHPGDKPLNSPQSATISLTFSKSIAVDRLNLVGPLSNQLVNSSSLRFTGEMKSFTNNTVGFVLRDAQGEVLSEKIFMADSQGSGGDFIKFDKTVEIGTLPADVTETGQIDFFNASTENDRVLLSVPVRFR